MSRFLVLMAEPDHFDRWDEATDREQQAFFEGLAAFAAEVKARGAIVAGEGLDRPDAARTLRDGTVTEGPYAETTEQVGGFYLVDLPSLDDALEVARLLPVPTVEVRPTVEA